MRRVFRGAILSLGCAVIALLAVPAGLLFAVIYGVASLLGSVVTE